MPTFRCYGDGLKVKEKTQILIPECISMLSDLNHFLDIYKYLLCKIKIA